MLLTQFLLRAMMAGVRSTKGPFLVFTLLCLVCFSDAWFDKDVLENLKEQAQRAKQSLDKIKVEHNLILSNNMKQLHHSLNHFDLLTVLMKSGMNDLPADFPRMDELLENLKKSQALLDEDEKKLARGIKDTEEEVERQLKQLKCLEEQHDELLLPC